MAALVGTFFIFNGTSDSYQPNLSPEESASRQASVELGTAIYATVLSIKSPWIEAASNLYDCATGNFCDPTSWSAPGSASMYDDAVEDSQLLLPSPTPLGNKGTIVLTEGELDDFGSNYGKHRGHVYITRPEDVDALEGEQLEEIERRLGRGFNDGTDLVRADIDDIYKYNPRIPDNNTPGNSNYRPGGVTSGGLFERIIDPINLKSPSPNITINRLRHR